MAPSLLEARRLHATELVRPGPASRLPPQPLAQTLEASHRVSYSSAGRALVGLYHPPTPRSSPAPALLYLHGGWALADAHMHQCQPFVDAGFAVFAPSYRGENGNPGAHEMLWGELEDAHAALANLRARPEVDATRVFIFGHSAGGMLAMLMSFDPELPAHLSGSVAGIYGPEVFDYQRLPFVDTPTERTLRLALPFIEQLEQPHLAFVGRHDLPTATTAEAGRRARAAGVPLETIPVAGDHTTSVAPSMIEFLACAQRVL